MESCSYMCAECFQVCDSIDAFHEHECQITVDNIEMQEQSAGTSQRGQVLVINSSPESESVPAVTSIEEMANVAVKEVPSKTASLNLPDSSYKQSEGMMSFSDLGEVSHDEDDPCDKTFVKKRKKYQAMDESYRLNRTMRDKDFKLARSHFYSFKDTLGDWDERSTQLLIQLIHKYPETHFLLTAQNEKRMGHWEKLHQEMETAGYNFTILQLRMRWREVLQKYRWTVDYNDFHEIKKRCEYFDEMNELFGDWDKEATQALLKQMHHIKRENQGKKIIRIGYNGWEKITEDLNSDGHKFTIQMVEARWRNLVTRYKTMVDHNSIPNVDPQSVAFKEDLEELVKYVPQRRSNYEKKIGRSVKMERFPSNGSRVLLQAYKDCMSRFVDPEIDNRILWDEITRRLEDEGFNFTTAKLKEILTGMIKGFEKCQHHNSLPGAIRRDVPYYRELAEVYGVYGRWPHIQTSRTLEMRTQRKFRLRLQVSQQLWSLEESRALLQVYPDVLESHVSQCLSHQPSDLWLQVAKAYAATGHPKRDVPEIAIHIGLLRQGYAQNNKFPLVEEMRKVKESEEAVCYSPDVSKFTGDVEVIYWSHEAVNLLLDLYIKHQATAASSHAGRNEVFVKIKESMQKVGYKYTKDEICDQFKSLLTQYNTRKSKPWMLPPVGRHTHNPVGAPYLDKLERVLDLRKTMSLSWTTGVKPLLPQAQKIVLQVACQKADELLTETGTEREKKVLLAQIVDGVIVHIRTNQLVNPVPRTRQVRLHIADALKSFNKRIEKNKDVIQLHKLFEDYDMLKLLRYLSLEPTNYDNRMESKIFKKRKHSVPDEMENEAEIGTKAKYETPGSILEIEADSPNSTDKDWISDDEQAAVLKDTKEELSEASEYLAFALCYLKNVNQDQHDTFSADILERNADCENSLQNRETDSKGTECVQGFKYFSKNSEKSVDDVSHVSSFDEHSLKVEKTALCDQGIDKLYVSRPSVELEPGASSNHSEDPSDVYEKLFGEVYTAVPVKCSKQSKGKMYTFSGYSKSRLNLVLPEELNICVGDVAGLEKDSKGKKKRHRHRAKRVLCDETSSSITSGSEAEQLLKEELLSPEEDDILNSFSQIAKTDPETKVIQTRSGRKTRFTFFSQTLKDNMEDNLSEDSSASLSSEVISPVKKVKYEPDLISCTPKKKKGRPRKGLDNCVLSYEIAEDAITVLQNDSTTKVSLNELQVSEKCHKGIYLKGGGIMKASVLSFTEKHERERNEKQLELIELLKQQQKEQSDILVEICNIIENLHTKSKKS